MKLAIVRQRYTPFGGAERFVDLALDALRRDGVETALVTRQWHGDWQGPVYQLDPPYLGRRGRDRGFARAVGQLLQRGEFDLVQSHERIPGCHLYRAGDGVHATWLRQRGLVLGVAQRVALGYSPYHRYLLRTEAEMFRHSALRGVICNSRMVADDIGRRFGVSADRLHVVYSGVDSSRFHPDLRAQHHAAVRARIGCPVDAKVFLHVGSGFERKGVDTAIDAFAALGKINAELWIIGTDRHAARYQARAATSGAGPRIRFLGPQQDVAPYYGAADAGVLASLYDPLPNATLEALACGLPVIVSDCTGTAELLQPGENGWVCAANAVGELVNCLRVALPRLGDPALAVAARRTVAALTPAAMVGRYREIYTAVSAVPADRSAA